jgi:cell wall-associated NlpC family hydrolase
MIRYLVHVWARSILLMMTLLLATAMVSVVVTFEETAPAKASTVAVTFRQTAPAKASTAPPDPLYATAAPAGLAAGNEATSQAAVNKKGAVTWALKNVDGGYNNFGDDCTDFVSRALAIGGGDPFTYPRGINGSTSNDHYWYFFTVRYGRWWSHSWSVAKDLAMHLNLRKSHWLKYWNDAQPGDVIFANWSNGKFSGISHVGIITKMSHGVPMITQHSPSQKNVSLNYWLKHGGRDVHVWIASPAAG